MCVCQHNSSSHKIRDTEKNYISRGLSNTFNLFAKRNNFVESNITERNTKKRKRRKKKIMKKVVSLKEFSTTPTVSCMLRKDGSDANEGSSSHSAPRANQTYTQAQQQPPKQNSTAPSDNDAMYEFE